MAKRQDERKDKARCYHGVQLRRKEQALGVRTVAEETYASGCVRCMRESEVGAQIATWSGKEACILKYFDLNYLY